MEKLRDAQGGDFTKQLDSFQKGQDDVESEIERQRAIEKAELERRLKNRRAKARAKKEMGIKEDADAIAGVQQALIDKLREEKGRIKKVIDAETQAAEKETVAEAPVEFELDISKQMEEEKQQLIDLRAHQ
jgi:hypothetical protein